MCTLSAAQKRLLGDRERQGTQNGCQELCGAGGIASRNFTVCVDENGLGGNAYRRWSIRGAVGGARIY